MRRRDLLKIFGAAVVSPSIVLPASVRAQQPRRTKRVGVVMVNAETDPDGQVRANAFRQGLEQLGWSGSRNLQLEFRWGAGSPERAQRHATELVAWEPDAILANGTPAVAALQKATSTIPIVFAVVTDPVGAGFVQSLSYPGGNITGFSTFEPAIGNKWVELLQEIAPKTQRIACVLDPGFRGFSAIHREIESVAPKLGLAITTIGFRERSDDLEGALARFAAARGASCVPDFHQQHRACTDYFAFVASSDARHLSVPALCDGRWPVGLWFRHARSVRAQCNLCRSRSQGCEAVRSAGSGSDQVRTGDQPADGGCPWPLRFCDADRPRRCGGWVESGSDACIGRTGNRIAATALTSMAKEPVQPSKPPAEEPGKPYPVENPPDPHPNEDRPLVDPVPPDKDLPRMRQHLQ